MGRYVPRANLGGNFCGHNPRNPRFTLTRPAKTGKGGIPPVLTLCAERLQDYYHRPRQVIPSLDLANGSARQQRSERREACVLLLTALLKYTDLASLRVGIPTPEGFLNLTVGFLAAQTGLTLGSSYSAGPASSPGPRRIPPAFLPVDHSLIERMVCALQAWLCTFVGYPQAERYPQGWMVLDPVRGRPRPLGRGRIARG